MLLSQRLAEWIARQPHQMPSDVADRVEELVLDSIGCATAGAALRETQLLADGLVTTAKSVEKSSRWPVNEVGAERAIFLHAFAANCVDADDTHLPTMVHPGSVIVPPTLIVGAVENRTGREVIRGIASGYEVAIRLASYAHYKKGWHSTGTVAIFGAVTSLSSILRLSREQCAHALCIAASMAAGIRANFGSPARSLHAGRAASSAYLAVQLARRGFSAQQNALEGGSGFNECFGDLVTDPHLADDPKRLAIFESTFKPYASGVVTHATLDAAIRMRKKLRSGPGQLAQATITVAPMVTELARFEQPTTGLEAKLSLTHCVAVGIARGSGAPSEFMDTAVQDPLINELRTLCRVETDASLQPTMARLQIRTKDGLSCEEIISSASGSAGSPMGRDEVIAKFTDYFGSARSSESTSAVRDAVLSLDGLPDAGELLNRLEWL